MGEGVIFASKPKNTFLMKESLNMRTRQILLDIVCALIIGLVIFFFAGGFAWGFAKDLFGSPFSFLECVLGLFVFVSLLSALATCVCRLFRIHFIPRKTEKRIAAVYFCLAMVGIYPLIGVSLLSIFTLSPKESLWLITRNQLSILGMVLSVVWLAVLSAKLLVRTRRQTMMDSPINTV